MSVRLTFPLSREDARLHVNAALVPTVAHDRFDIPCGHIECLEGFTPTELKGCVAVLGAFDGFHLGHAKLVSDARDAAKSLNKPLVAVTFWPDPSEALGHPEGRLMDADQRIGALLGAGVLAVIVLRFDEKLASLSPVAFVDALLRYLSPEEVHVGENFRFGSKGSGDANILAELCGSYGVNVNVSKLYEVNGAPVSATRVRELVTTGQLGDAAELLGHFLSYTGTVSHGRGEGKDLGFATANLLIEKERVLLAPGVYAGYTVVNGLAWPTAANAGVPVSFGVGEDNLIEAHLVGFSEAIYGEMATFVPLRMLRGEQRFKTREELVNTVLGNIDWVTQNLGSGAWEVEA